jgi:hypothetical protein
MHFFFSSAFILWFPVIRRLERTFTCAWLSGKIAHAQPFKNVGQSWPDMDNRMRKLNSGARVS